MARYQQEDRDTFDFYLQVKQKQKQKMKINYKDKIDNMLYSKAGFFIFKVL